MFSFLRKTPTRPLRASLYINPDFYCFRTVSGIDINLEDPTINPVILGPQASNTELVNALFSSLLASRAPKHRHDPNLYNYRMIEAGYKNWRRQMMDKFGYKTQKKMFDEMRLLQFEYNRFECTISVETLYQEKPQRWTASHRQPKIRMSSKLEPEALGEDIKRLSKVNS